MGPGSHALSVNEVRDPVREHTRLPAPRPRQHQQRALGGDGGFTLRFVELFQQVQQGAPGRGIDVGALSVQVQ